MARPLTILVGAALVLGALAALVFFLFRFPGAPPAEPEAAPVVQPAPSGAHAAPAGPPLQPARAPLAPAPATPAPAPAPSPAPAPGTAAAPMPPRTREEVVRERQERVAYFKIQLAGLRERAARLERDLSSLVSAGHGDRPAAVQFRQELESARRAEPRMQRHLQQAEWELRYGPLPAGSR